MLILTRKSQETIVFQTPSGVAELLIMEVAQVHNGKSLMDPRVKVGITCPDNWVIVRKELL